MAIRRGDELVVEVSATGVVATYKLLDLLSETVNIPDGSSSIPVTTQRDVASGYQAQRSGLKTGEISLTVAYDPTDLAVIIVRSGSGFLRIKSAAGDAGYFIDWEVDFSDGLSGNPTERGNQTLAITARRTASHVCAPAQHTRGHPGGAGKPHRPGALVCPGS